MAALVHFGHIVAHDGTFEKIHVKMAVLRRVTPFFTEHNRLTRLSDTAFNHRLVNNHVYIGQVASHLRLEIVIPAVNNVTAIGGIEWIVDRVRAVGDRVRNVTRTFQNARVLITVAKLAWPASLDRARWKISVVIVEIYYRSQAKLSQIVDASDPLARFLGPRQGWQQHASENGNNGNDHQQFNQSKCESARSPQAGNSKRVRVALLRFQTG